MRSAGNGKGLRLGTAVEHDNAFRHVNDEPQATLLDSMARLPGCLSDLLRDVLDNLRHIDNAQSTISLVDAVQDRQHANELLRVPG